MFWFARLLALICLIGLILLPKSIFDAFKQPEVQIIVATFVLTVLIMFDVYSGLILGIGLIVVYYRLFNEKVSVDSFASSEVRNKGPMACIMGKYITNEHLKSAQNNVVDETEMDTQIIGMAGKNSEQVFGAQGTYKKISGFDNNVTFANAQLK